MSYFTSKAAVILCSAALGLEGGLPLPSDPGTPAPVTAAQEIDEARPQDAAFLEITSDGYSRFEVLAGEVVVHCTGGVDFKYMNYTGHAEELVYHQAGQQAVAIGDVRFTLDNVELSSAQVNMDVLAGTASLGPAVFARLRDQGLFMKAQSANLTFTPGCPPREVMDVVVDLSGGVSAYSMLGSWLVTDSIRLDGPAGTISTNGPFTLALSSEQMQDAQTEAGMAWGIVRLSGQLATLKFEKEGILTGAEITGVRLTNDLGSLAAGTASIKLEGNTEQPRWKIELQGAPVSGQFTLSQRAVQLSCQRLAGVLDADHSMQAVLEGNVSLATGEQTYTGEQLSISYPADGLWKVITPCEFHIGFKLADEELELTQLPGLEEE